MERTHRRALNFAIAKAAILPPPPVAASMSHTKENHTPPAIRLITPTVIVTDHPRTREKERRLRQKAAREAKAARRAGMQKPA